MLSLKPKIKLLQAFDEGNRKKSEICTFYTTTNSNHSTILKNRKNYKNYTANKFEFDTTSYEKG